MRAHLRSVSCFKKFLSLKSTIVVISGNGLEFSGFIGELSSVLARYAVNYAMQYPQRVSFHEFFLKVSSKSFFRLHPAPDFSNVRGSPVFLYADPNNYFCFRSDSLCNGRLRTGYFSLPSLA
jgi:hypothetical protein